jgi:aldose 1-epimerase
VTPRGAAVAERPAIAPTGEQIELVAGDQRVVVVEVGGGIRSYAVGSEELLDGYGPDEMALSGRGQVLIPWPNRLRGGTYEFDGRRHQVPLNEPDLGNAIHGLVRWVAWSIAEREPHRVVTQYTLHPQPGYPFSLDVRIEYVLSGDGLVIRTTATNTGAEACPFGCGAHPWLRAMPGTDDRATLRIPADIVLRVDERGIPIGEVPVAGTDLDFRVSRPIGSTRIDHAFTELARDDDGMARVTFRGQTGRLITVWFDVGYPFVQLSSGDVLPDVDRHSLAIEPMTCPPNAFQTGAALIRLEPGDSFTGTWGITPENATRGGRT